MPGRRYWIPRADVIMLDCLGFHQQRHRDILQQALDVPVLPQCFDCALEPLV